MKKTKFSDKDVDVMNVLWAADKSLAVSEIILIDPSININTAHSVTRRLLKMKAIKIKSIGMVSKALTRLFVPTIDQETFILMEYPDPGIWKLVFDYLAKLYNMWYNILKDIERGNLQWKL